MDYTQQCNVGWIVYLDVPCQVFVPENIVPWNMFLIKVLSHGLLFTVHCPVD